MEWICDRIDFDGLFIVLTNSQGVCRHCILYPLRLRLSFPNDGKIPNPKVGLEPNQIEIDLRKAFMKNITHL